MKIAAGTDAVSASRRSFMEVLILKVEAYIHSLKDKEHDRHVLGEAEIIKSIGDNLYLAKYNDVKCTAIFNPFVGRYFVDDVYGVQREQA